MGARAFSHSGLGCGLRGERSIWTSSTGLAIFSLVGGTFYCTMPGCVESIHRPAKLYRRIWPVSFHASIPCHPERRRGSLRPRRSRTGPDNASPSLPPQGVLPMNLGFNEVFEGNVDQSAGDAILLSPVGVTRSIKAAITNVTSLP